MVPMISSSTFSLGLFSVALNPGLFASFPWLSPIAQNFQSYRFTSLSFTYVPTCGTTTTGLLMMAFDPDPSNPSPNSLPAMYSYRVRVASQPWARTTLSVPVSSFGGKSSLRKMVRNAGETVANSSLPNFDLGTFYLYAGNGTAIPLCGTLEVAYTVEFFVPQPPEGGGISVSEWNPAVTGTTPSVPAPWGNPIVPLTGSLECQFVYNSLLGNVLTFPLPGTYWISLAISGTGSPSYGISASSTVTTLQWNGVGTSTLYIWTAVLKVVDDSSTVSFDFTSGTTVTAARLLVCLGTSFLS